MRRNVVQKILGATIVALIALAVTTNQSYAHPDHGCESCHVPHAASTDTTVPLWNPAHMATTLEGGYDSTTMQAVDNAEGPNGASRLCLSCHDGTTFNMDTDSHREAFFGAGGGMGDTLMQSHPVSFTYDTALADADGELEDPATNAEVASVLDPEGRMQCTSCHDVHSTAVDYGREDQANLRWEYHNTYGPNGVLYNADFCRKCHQK